MKTALKVILPIILAVLWARLAVAHHTPLVLSHYFGKRTGNCTLKESFDAEALTRLQSQNVASLRASSRVIRKEEQFILWLTPAGEFWVPNGGDALLFDLAEQQRNIYGTRIRPGDIVLDAGANVGVFTRKALRAGAAKVIAIEPGPENLDCLRRTFTKEIADGRVVVYPKGVWDKDDTLKLSVNPANSAQDSFVRPIPNGTFVDIPLTSIDQMVAELHLTRVDFIKMDIEGAERKAVIGARQTIRKYHPRMALCIYHVEGDETVVPQLVHDAVPDYTVSKTCLCASDRIQPEVAFFY
jgi:FkbM family methyltransferase